MKRGLIAVAVGLMTLAGCGTAAPGQGSSPAVTATTAPPSPAAGVTPASLRVPAIGAESTLIPLGLNGDGTMQVPDVHHPKQAGWFEPGPEPGQAGPAVIAGHIDGDHQKGVFYELSKVKAGDTVEVQLSDGRTLTFTVYAAERVDKDAFPADKVFGYTAEPEVRLITCGGTFDRAARSYEDNTIIYARLS